MKYSVFLTYNIVGGIVWGAGVTLLGYLLGQFTFIAAHVDLIFVLIVLVSVVPILVEVSKRVLASRRNATAPDAPVIQDEPAP
jgi:membrane-associated protein